jgi:nucleotide-binding universal stress UspA family protein
VAEESLLKKLNLTRDVNAGCDVARQGTGSSGRGGMMKFLVGYDGTDATKAALSLARSHAEVFGARVFIISSTGGGSSEKPDKINEAVQNLAYASQFFKEKGIPCETFQTARGVSPGEDLVIFAEENDIDQIFVGVKKKSRTQKIILGSNAQYVILKAPCPVVTVKT